MKFLGSIDLFVGRIGIEGEFLTTPEPNLGLTNDSLTQFASVFRVLATRREQEVLRDLLDEGLRMAPD